MGEGEKGRRGGVWTTWTHKLMEQPRLGIWLQEGTQPLPLCVAVVSHPPPPTCRRECTGRLLAGLQQQSHLVALTGEERKEEKIQLSTDAHKRERKRERGGGRERLQSAIVFNDSFHVRTNDNNFADEGS